MEASVERRTHRSDEGETDATVERRAERIVDIEEQLRRKDDKFEEKETDVDIYMDVSLNFESPVATARVADVHRSDQWLVITVEVEGDEVEFDLPWPDNTRDGSEPLVRLCRWCGVDIRDFASLTSVPVVDVDGEWRLVTPPCEKTERVAVSFNGRQVEFTRPLFFSWFQTTVARAAFALLWMPWFKPRRDPESSPHSHALDFDDRSFTAITVLSALVAGVAGSVFVGPLAVSSVIAYGVLSLFLILPTFLITVILLDWAGGADLRRPR